jgi:pilus assembly protein CpaE
MALAHPARRDEEPPPERRPEATSILAFVDDPVTAESVRRALAELGDAQAEVRRGGIGKAIAHLNGARSPDVLIVDLAQTELPLSAIGQLAEACEPGVHVIALGERNDVSLYRDLVQAGVADYLVKPLTGELIRRSIEATLGRAAAARISDKRGKLVAFVGARGGVGTTTLAANVAWHLAEKAGRRVALVDLDLQSGGCGFLLDLEPNPALGDMLSQAGALDELAVERAMEPCGERLFVLSSETPIEETPPLEPEALEHLLDILRARFHYVVVDLPRALVASHREVLERAELRFIVADRTLRALRDVVRLKQVLARDGGLGRTLLALNRNREGGEALPLARFLATAGLPAAAIAPFDPKEAVSAATFGTPLAARGSRLAKAIETLAAEISGQPAERPGLLRRLLG